MRDKGHADSHASRVQKKRRERKSQTHEVEQKMKPILQGVIKGGSSRGRDRPARGWSWSGDKQEPEHLGSGSLAPLHGVSTYKRR